MEPLAERLRPKSIEDIIGQQHILNDEAVLYRMLKAGKVPSMILWGPPGVGKTSLANVIANSFEQPFYSLSAINSGVKDIREVINRAQKGGFFNNKRPILFIDEIHRFSKSQQDSLLNAVEKGIVTLIGATTENPSFEVIPALLSRCQTYILEHLTKDDLISLLHKAIKKDAFLKSKNIKFKEYKALIYYSGGDARKLLNGLELISIHAENKKEIIITDKLVKSIIQKNIRTYDKNGEMHYDVISAFIKSVRGSDPNAAIYYLARMIDGGEDPKFIARRLVILASEDVGLANPNAMLIANACFEAVHNLGYPEARIPMAQATIYLACSPKSNAAYLSIDKALALVKETGELTIPKALRNAPTKLMKELNYGAGYKYAHDYPDSIVDMDFLPEEIKGNIFYKPSNNPAEERLTAKVIAFWKDKYGY